MGENERLISQGQGILRDIDQAEAYLASASNWGLADMIFGGGLTSLVKQSKIRKGQALINKLERDLASFKFGLGQQGLTSSQIGDLEAFVDIFFDNIFVDFFIQDKLAKKRTELTSLRTRLERILRSLEER